MVNQKTIFDEQTLQIVVGSCRHKAYATPRNIARPPRPITCCCRGFGARISQNRTDWYIRMPHVINMLLHSDNFICRQSYFLVNIPRELNRKTFHRTSKTISCFTSHGVCTDVHQCLCSMFTSGIFIENKCFIRASRHWQALFKRMNGQVIAPV